MVASAQPYREPPEPCPDCVAREETQKKMQKFALAGERFCPECGSSEHRWWKWLCTGGEEEFKNSVGKLFWKKRVVIHKCEFPEDSPKHFHLWCQSCSTVWAMLTKSEMGKL